MNMVNYKYIKGTATEMKALQEKMTPNEIC